MEIVMCLLASQSHKTKAEYLAESHKILCVSLISFELGVTVSCQVWDLM